MINMISSSPLTTVTPAKGPFFSVMLAVLIPLPPRPLTGYSEAAVRFPYPFSEITNTSESGYKISDPTT